MKMSQTKLVMGGMLRCCLATLEDYAEGHMDEEIEEGRVLDCAHEAEGNRRIIYKDGAWRWNRESEAGLVELPLLSLGTDEDLLNDEKRP